jgi:hypothetical protein
MKGFFVYNSMEEVRLNLIKEIVEKNKLCYVSNLDLFYFYNIKYKNSLVIDINNRINEIKNIFYFNDYFKSFDDEKNNFNNIKLYQILETLPLLKLQFINHCLYE